MTKQLKNLTNYAVLAAGLLAAVPHTARAEFNPYETVGKVAGSVDPRGIYTASLLLGSFASYIVLNNFKQHCGCHRQQNRNCFVEFFVGVGNYAKHVGTTALGLATTGACYAALSGIEKGAQATAGLFQKSVTTDPLMHTQVNPAVAGLSSNEKCVLAALGGAVAVSALALLCKKFKSHNDDGDNDNGRSVRWHPEQ